MSGAADLKLVVLFDHEVRAAAVAVAGVREKIQAHHDGTGDPPTPEEFYAALRLCGIALGGAQLPGSTIVLTSVDSLVARSGETP